MVSNERSRPRSHSQALAQPAFAERSARLESAASVSDHRPGKSISRAAARLFLTQSAVSQSLKRLEEQLECPLILRRGPRFDLSPAGEEVLRIAEEIYGNVARLSATLKSPEDDVVGKVRILTISKVQSALYDDFLVQFHRDHPRVELEVEVMGSSDIQSALSQRTATVGLGLCRFPQAKLERRRLLRQRYAFFCGKRHRLFGQRKLPSKRCRARISSVSPAIRWAAISRR